MHVCMHAPTHACTHAHTHTCTYTHTHTHIYVCTHTGICVHTHVYVCTPTHTHRGTCTYEHTGYTKLRLYHIREQWDCCCLTSCRQHHNHLPQRTGWCNFSCKLPHCFKSPILIKLSFWNFPNNVFLWTVLRMYLWWSLCTLYLHAHEVRVTIGDSCLCCTCVTYFER